MDYKVSGQLADLLSFSFPNNRLICKAGERICPGFWCHNLEAEKIPCILLVIAIILMARVPELDLTLFAAI